MTPNELTELEEGKKWLEDLIHKAKDIQIPTRFTYLERRIQQLRCSALNSNEIPSIQIKLIIRYFLGTGFIFYLLLKSQFSKNKIRTSFSIWDSDIAPHVDSETFNHFLNSNQVVSLKKESFVFVQSSKFKKLYTHTLHTKNPIYDVLENLDISFKEGFVLIKNILENFFIYLRISYSCPSAKGLFKDFLTEPIIKLYKQKGMIKFYRTNSSFNNQEFWCENIDYNTVWYSINSRAIQYKNTYTGPIPENPAYYFMYFGTSWTWNEAHATWLKRLFDHQVNIVGPIMFYSLSIKNQNAVHQKKLLIFDVTPYEESFARKNIIQKGLNFYNENYCTQFISDIITALEGEDWDILLKPKRAYLDNIHSKKYIDFLSQLQATHARFKILPPQSNLFNEIQKADLVITIPFSSPFDIAKSMNIPSIYFDPSGDVDFASLGYDKEDYAFSITSLKDKIIR